LLGWAEFEIAAPEISLAGSKLFAQNDVAFIATVAVGGRPRIHPFVPKIVAQRLVAFIMDSSPKLQDLELRRQYSIHTQLGCEDEEFTVSGAAYRCNDDAELRSAAAVSMGFATGVDDHHILHEFLIDRGLWTTWLDFGAADHRPQYTRWILGQTSKIESEKDE